MYYALVLFTRSLFGERILLNSVTMTGPPASPEEILAKFHRLIRELLSGSISRNTFQPWEIELLLDIETCRIQESARKNILRRWQRAVEQQMEKGATMPMKLSEFLSRRR
jgi:hypothetical protein